MSLQAEPSNHFGNGSAHQAENDGGAQRNEPFLAKQLEANVAGQSAKAEFLQPRGEAVDQQQR